MQIEDSKDMTAPYDQLSLILQDVSYLFNREYDKRRAIDFVASRYQLERFLRNFIFRTMSSDSTANQTKAKILTADQLKGINLGVDGFNILLTILEIIQNKPVYLCYDHVIRDISGNYGKIRSSDDEKRAIQIFAGVLLDLPLERFTIFLDEPVSHSGEIARKIRDELTHQHPERSQELSKDFRLTEAVSTVKSPDYELSKFDVVASHDSIVIQKAKRIFDIPRHIMTLGLLSPTVINIRSLLEGTGVIPDDLKVKLGKSR